MWRGESTCTSPFIWKIILKNPSCSCKATIWSQSTVISCSVLWKNNTMEVLTRSKTNTKHNVFTMCLCGFKKTTLTLWRTSMKILKESSLRWKVDTTWWPRKKVQDIVVCCGIWLIVQYFKNCFPPNLMSKDCCLF